MKTVIKNKRELASVAREVLKMKPGIIALEGPLGAGKTALTKVLAAQLGIIENVTSPTFVLNVQYTNPHSTSSGLAKSQIRLEHIDCWRMESGVELEQLGFEKMLDPKSIAVVEWAELVKEVILKYKKRVKIVWVEINYGEKESERKIQITNIK